MKVHVDRYILGLDGKPLLDDPDGKPTELRMPLIKALDHAPKGLTAQQSVDRYRAMLKIMEEDTPDIPIEILSVIKENLAACFVPRIAGQAILMLEES